MALQMMQLSSRLLQHLIEHAPPMPARARFGLPEEVQREAAQDKPGHCAVSMAGSFVAGYHLISQASGASGL